MNREQNLRHKVTKMFSVDLLPHVRMNKVLTYFSSML